MSKVCDGLRGDAFVAAHEVGLDNLCEIVDGIPQGIDTLIQHVSGMVFHLTEHASNELFRQYCRPGGPLSRQNGESMKQHVSRRRRCWIFMSGLTREERIMVQASISNARELDRVAEALIKQHPRFHLRENQRRTKGKGKDGLKRVDTPNTCWFREKGKCKHTGSGKSGTSAHHANFSSVEFHDFYYDEVRVKRRKRYAVFIYCSGRF